MKKIILWTVTGIALISVAALAHAQSQQAPSQHMGGSVPMVQGQMLAQGMGQGMGNAHGGGHNSPVQPKGDTGPSSLAFAGINQKMHQSMDITFTGNADVDFIQGMIPHHEGAIDMAKTVLAFGKDPEVKKLAGEIIKAQESEIALMQEWLKKNAR